MIFSELCLCMSEGRLRNLFNTNESILKTEEVKNKLSIQLEIHVLDRYELTKRETS